MPPPSRRCPVGGAAAQATEDDEGDRGAPFRADELPQKSFRQARRSGQASIAPGTEPIAASAIAAANERQEQVEAHLRPDLHDQPRAVHDVAYITCH